DRGGLCYSAFNSTANPEPCQTSKKAESTSIEQLSATAAWCWRCLQLLSRAPLLAISYFPISSAHCSIRLKQQSKTGARKMVALKLQLVLPRRRTSPT